VRKTIPGTACLVAATLLAVPARAEERTISCESKRGTIRVGVVPNEPRSLRQDQP